MAVIEKESSAPKPKTGGLLSWFRGSVEEELKKEDYESLFEVEVPEEEVLLVPVDY